LIDGITNPTLFNKEQSKDHRGSLEYYNSVSLEKFKRFYIVENPYLGTVRAWHGHKVEGKLFRVLKGQFVLCAVLIDNWEKPSKELEVEKFTIDENSGVVYIPPGYANGLINIVPESKIMTLSTLIYTDALHDDFRYSSKYWNPWQQYSPQIYE
tara:strand:- start:45 stop:506 length:462 start_codon:yes stop_codon:yes gene_type:complete